MKTYVVNLDKNTVRMTFIDSQLRKLGVEYQRFRAVYGKELPDDEKRKCVNHFAFWCLRGYPIRDGEIGCALSHLNIYRQMVKEDIPIACVLEDDADPHACLPELLDWLEKNVDTSKPVTALISNHGHRESSEFGMYPIQNGAFTDGYVITKPAAEKILAKNFPVKGPSDSWTFWRSKGWIELYQATPAGCNQLWEEAGYTSDVTPDNSIVVDVRRMSVAGKMVWKMKRAVGMLIAKLLF